LLTGARLQMPAPDVALAASVFECHTLDRFPLNPADPLWCARPGLTDALLTGGVPPAIAEPCPAERTYRALYKRVLLQNARYYHR
jgi:hypothetical protein